MRISQIQKDLKLALIASLEAIARRSNQESTVNYAVELDIPREEKFGDLTTNIALRASKKLSTNGVTAANMIKDALSLEIERTGIKEKIESVQVSPPGFINIKFQKSYFYSVLDEILCEKDSFGKGPSKSAGRVNIEFVSANPTGPLTIAHGRQAAVGDALARILEYSGYKVCREYFLNDYGRQIELLGESIYARYLEVCGNKAELPEDGYMGEYIKTIARELEKKFGDKLREKTATNIERISEFGVDHIMKLIKRDLETFGVSFDKWFSQKTISDRKIECVLEELRKEGYVYEKDGARWFKSTAFGDDKDRVVVKSDGAFTYLAPDIYYHKDKYKRGFNRIINIWGPDHHGYIARLRASCEALGHDKNTLSVLIVQLATLYRDGVMLSMSTRKGEFITLREVIDEVGVDVTKYFFLMRKLDTHLDFDLEIAKKESMENPVYYIQYAHARIASILDFSAKLREMLMKTTYDARLLAQEEEMRLLRIMSQFPLVIEASAKMLEPFRVVEYLNELAKAFHSFYTKHRVVNEEDLDLTRARLSLVSGVKIVLANGLGLLGISFPDRM